MNELNGQTNEILGKLEQKLILKLHLDPGPLSKALEQHISSIATLTDKLSLQTETVKEATEKTPYVEICKADGSATGLAFHGVPSEHELNSFIIGLSNAAAPGQALDSDTLNRIRSIHKPLELMVLVTLSCPMCPELVIAAQHIAAINPNVTADIYDIRHFAALRQKYNVMSVPCLVINGENVSFGKKSIEKLLDYIDEIL